jgi:3-ketosteroid 9alpha-monooxygenase subunit B
MHEDAPRAHGFHPVRVKRVIEETADSRTFVLDVPPGLFSYRPGQFCTFRVRIGGEEALRSYSMSSAPQVDDDLAVTVKRVPGGLVSNWLVDTVKPGDELECTRPAGVFCPTERRAPAVAFCGGSGITPVMSIAKSVLVSTHRPVRLLYANRTPESVIFAGALEEMAASHDGRLLVRHHSDSSGGYLDGARIASFVEGELEADFYICGPGPFMDLVESTLTGLGVSASQIFIERFTVDEPAPRVRDDESSATCSTESLTIVLKGKATTVAYQAGDTVLETARRGGLKPPFSCEAGNCATCMAFLHEGTVTMRANNALTPDEVEEGWILTCQSRPTSSTVRVEYENV